MPSIQHVSRRASDTRAFGQHMRSLRRVRALSQETLAERSGLSPDTVRRLEAGSFSPSLDTLTKLTCGLGISLPTLFLGFEFAERSGEPQLLTMTRMVKRRSPRELELAMSVLRSMFAALDESRETA